MALSAGQQSREVRVERGLGRGGAEDRGRAQPVPGEPVGDRDRLGGVAAGLDAGGGLAALDRLLERARDGVDERAVALGVELGQPRAVDGAGAEREGDAQLGLAPVVERQQLAQERADVGRRRRVPLGDGAGAQADLVDRALVGGQQQVVLGREVVLDRADRHAGRARHRADAHRVEALLDDDADQGVGEVVARGEGWTRHRVRAIMSYDRMKKEMRS